MLPLFESIRYKNGVAEHLNLHQQRVDRAILDLGGTTAFNLADCLNAHIKLPNNDNQIYKCKIQYNLAGNFHINFEPYLVRKINTISVHDIGDNDYVHKYSNREWINNILLKSGNDDVIFTKNGIVKDASYANLVFFDGQNWITPSQPLLLGTRRASLIAAGIIKEALIQIKDLPKYNTVKLINAMMLWEESPTILLYN
jgi:4-amino-4-deoxychorismate lyase